MGLLIIPVFHGRENRLLAPHLMFSLIQMLLWSPRLVQLLVTLTKLPWLDWLFVLLAFIFQFPEHRPTPSGPRNSNFQDPAPHQHDDPESKEPSGNPGQPCTHLQGSLQLWTQDEWWWLDVWDAFGIPVQIYVPVFSWGTFPFLLLQVLTGSTQTSAALPTPWRWCATSLAGDRPAWKPSLCPRFVGKVHSSRWINDHN